MSTYLRILGKASTAIMPALKHLAGRGPSYGIVFHHIPKCGGVSISSALGAAYAPWLVHNIDPSRTVKAVQILQGAPNENGTIAWQEVHRLRTQLLAMHLAGGARCVSGHVQFSPAIQARFRETHRFVTVLRDPVERFVSQFLYSTRTSRSYDRRDMDWTEADLAVTGPRWGRTVARFLAGAGEVSDIEDEALIDRAKQSLHALDIVGFLDDLPAFAKAVHDSTGARLAIAHENRSSAKQTEALHEHPLMERVRDYCTVDRELYAYACQVFRPQEKVPQLDAALFTDRERPRQPDAAVRAGAGLSE